MHLKVTTFQRSQEAVPYDDVSVKVTLENLPEEKKSYYTSKMLKFLATEVSSTRHVAQ